MAVIVSATPTKSTDRIILFLLITGLHEGDASMSFQVFRAFRLVGGGSKRMRGEAHCFHALSKANASLRTEAIEHG
jgi:hypothetical protein